MSARRPQLAMDRDVEVVEERFWVRTSDAERGGGATDATDGGRVVGRGSSVDRHSQFVHQLVLLLSSEECGDGVCSRAQVAFWLEPGHPLHLARRVRWGPDGAGEVASRSSLSFPANWWGAPPSSAAARCSFPLLRCHRRRLSQLTVWSHDSTPTGISLINQ